jgi:flagellar basal-body rod modification protein FlgD
MINVDPITAATPTTQGAQGNKEMGKDTFLTLLVTQLQHQDPLEPMENTEFTAQLAQFSSLEQLQSVNSNLNYLQLYMASLNNAQAMGFIGQEITAVGNSVHYDGEGSTNLTYTLHGNAARVVINVFDKNGSLVRTKDMTDEAERTKGEHTYIWDGKDKSSDEVSQGEYTFEVLATDVEGNTISASTM